MKKVFISTGELSAEVYAEKLVRDLKRKSRDVEVYAIGSKLLAKAGCKIIADYKEISIIGLTEVFPKLKEIRRIYKEVVDFFKKEKPDLFIPVDFPGFNLKLIKKAKEDDIEVIYFIPPQIWAWHYSRIKIIKKYVDFVIPILPFEPEIYKKEGIPVVYYGHPIVDVFNIRKIDKYKEERYTIGVFPGSRVQEIEKIFPILSEAMRIITMENKKIKFLVSVAEGIKEEMLRKYIPNEIAKRVKFTYNKYEVFGKSRILICTSGTVTLEGIIAEKPMVVVYKVSPFTFFIAKHFLVKVKYISLVNLIAGKKVVEELIQNDLTSKSVYFEVIKLLSDDKKYKYLKKEIKRIKKLLGNKDVIKRITNFILTNFLK